MFWQTVTTHYSQGFFSRRTKKPIEEDVEVADPDEAEPQVAISDMFMYADVKDKILLAVGYVALARGHALYHTAFPDQKSRPYAFPAV